jgi:hypothetical protein
LAFLFGAGTSSAVNTAPSGGFVPLVPAIDALTEQCRLAVGDLGDSFADAWARIADECTASDLTVNIESILSRVQTKLDAVGEAERLSGLDRNGLRNFEDAIRTTIATAVTPNENTLPNHLPHDDFAMWTRAVSRTVPLELFTTNYDILFERAFEQHRIPVFDGFAGALHPFFYPECLEDDTLLPGPAWVRLWKLHGSVNWQLINHGGAPRITRGKITGTGEMILPSHRKYDHSRKQPYRAFMDRLAHVLARDHALLITAGYSFGDEHINAIIYSALDNRASTNVIALRYNDLSPDDPVTRAATQRPGFTLVGPNAGILGGQWGEWHLQHPDDRTLTMMASALQQTKPTAAHDKCDRTSQSVSVRLGDFNAFCSFLASMGHTRNET